MALNLEFKIKTENTADLIKKIKSAGGRLENLLNQTDTYYLYKKGLLKLREQNGEFQLIKYSRNENGGERWSDYSLLFIEGENIYEYLNDIFEEEICVKKERTLYIYKNTRIHLDAVEKLGHFLELETVVKNIDKTEAKIEFEEVIKILDLNKTNEINKSYRDIMLDTKSHQ